LRHHLARQTRRVLEVIRGTSRALPENEFLGDKTAQTGRQTIDELAAAVEVPVFLWQEPGETTRHAASDDADLVRRIRVREHVTHQSVPGLVVGDDLLLFLADDAALSLRPRDDTVNRFVELGHLYFLLAAPRRQDGAFVDQVRQVRA
jgi:hypothetical protein